MKYLLLLTSFFLSFAIWANDNIITPDKNDKRYVIKGKDLDPEGCRLCDFIPQIQFDMDNDGCQENLLFTDKGDQIGLNFSKYAGNQYLFNEAFNLNIDEGIEIWQNYFDIEVILHDFDKDGKKEIIIIYPDIAFAIDGIVGHVFKLNGGKVDFRQLKQLTDNSGLKISNIMEYVGTFHGLRYCEIKDDIISVNMVPNGFGLEKYLYRDGKLYHLTNSK